VKVIVIGLDGATFRLIDPLVAAGRLPTFAALMRRGVRGTLHSTLPPNSAAGWTAFMTGKNPGKTGIFGFFSLVQGDYQVALNNGGSIRAHTLWELASEAGKRVAIINVPYTYPPRPVNGVLVSGMDAPNLDYGTFPLEFGGELLTACPGYQIEMPPVRRHRDVKKQWFAEYLARYIETRWQAVRYTQQKVAPDLMVSVFTAPDRVHHWVLDDVTPNHPLRDETSAQRFGHILGDMYTQLDDILRAQLQAMDEHTMLFIVSDHGSNGFYRRFLVNHWLWQQGWLALVRGAKLSPIQQAVRYVRRQSRLYGLARRIKSALPFVSTGEVSRKSTGLSWRLKIIDWPQTQAFYLNGLGIRLNVRGREPAGIVKPSEYETMREQIMRKLEAVRDDVYHGPYTHQAADIILEESTLNTDPRLNFSTSGAIHPHRLNELYAVKRLPGDHDSKGMLLAAGPGLRRGTWLTGARLMDMAPTIMYAMGLPIPQDMDGQVLTEMFDEAFVKQYPIIHGKPAGEPDMIVAAHDGDELVEQRLRELGYFE
jgi:predicted AlkP superfamily phosphohydrolase/phosphomutase